MDSKFIEKIVEDLECSIINENFDDASKDKKAEYDYHMSLELKEDTIEGFNKGEDPIYK